jgi:hypothetical protein
MALAAPIATYQYDVLGDKEPNRAADIYWSQAAGGSLRRVPILIYIHGGSWDPYNSTYGDLPQRSSFPYFFEDLVDEGWCVMSMGYTLNNYKGRGNGQFHYKNWEQDENGDLIVDESKLEHRNAELDLVNLIQSIRYEGVPGVDFADKRPGQIWIAGRSAGFQIGAFVAYGPDRANPRASNPRLRVSTEVAGIVGIQTFGSFRAVSQFNQGHLHLATDDGVISKSMSTAGERNQEYASALWSAQNRFDRGQMQPLCHLSTDYRGTSAFDTNGPYTYRDLVGYDVDYHSPDYVKAFETFTNNHNASSFNYYADTSAQIAEAADDARTEWLLQNNGIVQSR